VVSFAVYHNGLYWAWASPCSGGCSNATPGHYGRGWRWVRNDQEWGLRPNRGAFGNNRCAAPQFDPTHNHCDWNDPIVYQHDGGSSELWLVHD
jgi:hypothetical protein